MRPSPARTHAKQARHLALAPAQSTASAEGVFALLEGLRPKQWTKNLLLFAAPLFAGSLARPYTLLVALEAFATFCLLSGAVYLANDVRDREGDRLHERKSLRPVASGRLSVRAAASASAVLAVVSLAAAFAIRPAFGSAALGFLALQTVYTLLLKHEVVLDVIGIATGFVLRAVAGALAVGVEVSPWFLLCTFLLALFLGLAKRRHELVLLEDAADGHRVSLAQYTPPMIDAMLSTSAAATIAAYALYTFFSHTAEHRPYLMVTIPFVVYGLFRYLYLVYKRGLGGNPEEILLTDVPLIADIVLWLAASTVILYFT